MSTEPLPNALAGACKTAEIHDVRTLREVEPVAFSARPLEWDLHESGEQWTDKHHGFCILIEPEEADAYCASWGEGDAEQFKTLEQAMAWCQRELDAWVRRYVVAAPPAPAQGEGAFDLVAHLRRQMEFSARTFGPGDRVTGVCDHIRKELREVQDDAVAGVPTLPEWVDVILLALDGAWRSGASPEQIAEAITAKQARNEGRAWPDWRTADPSKAIEHDRSRDENVEGRA